MDHHKRYLKKKKKKSIIVMQKVGWEYNIYSSYVCVVRFNSRLSDHYTDQIINIYLKLQQISKIPTPPNKS